MARGDVAVREAARRARQAVTETSELSSFHIHRFGRHADGYFHAEVAIGGGEDVYVHCRYGSWFLPNAVGSRSGREVLSPYRDALSSKMRQFEAAEAAKRRKYKEETMATSKTAFDAGRLLRLVGFSDEEVTGALRERFKVTEQQACGILQQVDEHHQQQEVSHGAAH